MWTRNFKIGGANTKTILLTGATQGIGLSTAKQLATQGHKLLIHGRKPDKLAAVERVLSSTGKVSVETYCADFANFDAVDNMVEQIKEKHSHIDVLINNAGLYKTKSSITNNRLDVRFVVNALSPYLLTQQLIPLMTPSSRVVNVSSAAQAPVDIDAMVGRSNSTNPFNAYAQSKLAITMWSRHLSLLSAAKRGPVIFAVNPGSILSSRVSINPDSALAPNILVRCALSKKFSDAIGMYYNNDIEEFGCPHPDALNAKKCQVLMEAIDDLFANRPEEFALHG